MSSFYSAPWHRASFDKFISETLPELLASRLPLTGYTSEQTDEYTHRVTVSLASNGGELEIAYDLLSPNEEGLFQVDGRPRVVVAVASSAHLDKAEIKCVGEQLIDYIEPRLGAITRETMPLDQDSIRAILPLDAWVRDVVTSSGDVQQAWATGQPLDTRNWLAAQTHLRRIAIKDIEDVITPSQFGRVCPFETPEGPNIGRVFSIALGARIIDGRLEIVDGRPEMALGLSASTVPFIEHNDSNRQLFGTNALRQWIRPENPEPAVVRTGREPDVPEFWCGHNLLTAFVFWGPETYEDSILISESCARRTKYTSPVEVGDKFYNRHGTKGTIGRILPDDEMPHLPDGTPVELVFSFIGAHTRLNFGQFREAIMSRIAKAEGEPAIIPSFAAPSEAEFKDRLLRAGLPEDGMEYLTVGKNGPQFPRPSTVGWVYWGRTVQTVASKIHCGAKPGDELNLHGDMQYRALRTVGAYANIADAFNLRSPERADADSLAERAAAGPVKLPGPPTPMFHQLRKRLHAAGIRAEFDGSSVTFHLAPVEEDKLELACHVNHPWLPGREVTELGIIDALPEAAVLVETNDRLRRLLATKAPESLKTRLRETLESRVRDYFAALISQAQVSYGDEYSTGRRVMFSGRSVATPSIDLRPDQVGLPEEMAWGLFGPLLERELGDPASVLARSPEAGEALDDLIAESWVIVNWPATFIPTCLLAFHPVRMPGKSIRLHQLALGLLNADYDGDQEAIFLPLTDEAQREAGEKLSIAGHLKRDNSLIKWLCPANEAVWGLAELSRTPEGLREIAEIAGRRVAAPDGFITRDALAAALADLLEDDGVEVAIAACERLMRRGFEVCKASGASLSPFAGSAFGPRSDGPAGVAEVTEMIESSADFDSADLGPQLLAVKSKARGSMRGLQRLIGPYGEVTDAQGDPFFVRHGFRDGLEPAELFATVPAARRGMARISLDPDWVRAAYGSPDYQSPQGYGVLARAMRSERPGLVFANACANNETDPLTDLDSRLFVGLEAT